MTPYGAAYVVIVSVCESVSVRMHVWRQHLRSLRLAALFVLFLCLQIRIMTSVVFLLGFTLA